MAKDGFLTVLELDVVCPECGTKYPNPALVVDSVNADKTGIYLRAYCCNCTKAFKEEEEIPAAYSLNLENPDSYVGLWMGYGDEISLGAKNFIFEALLRDRYRSVIDMAGDRIFLIPKAEQKEVQLMISLFNGTMGYVAESLEGPDHEVYCNYEWIDVENLEMCEDEVV